MPTRRTFTATSLVALAATASAAVTRAIAAGPAGKFEITKTSAEWKQQLSPAAYQVLRDHGTERPFSHAFDKLYEPGMYHCAGCDLPLFSSDTKYDSKTGWPSFWKPLDNALGTQQDRSYLLMLRTEYHCRRCGGHQGHVFEDGPKPTGQRYCNNGVALTFVPKAKTPS